MTAIKLKRYEGNPILELEAESERVGLVPNVVFPCGNVVIGVEIFVCCVGTSKLNELVDYVLANP